MGEGNRFLTKRCLAGMNNVPLPGGDDKNLQESFGWGAWLNMAKLRFLPHKCILNSFDLHSCCSEMSKRYTLRLLLICPEATRIFGSYPAWVVGGKWLTYSKGLLRETGGGRGKLSLQHVQTRWWFLSRRTTLYNTVLWDSLVNTSSM